MNKRTKSHFNLPFNFKGRKKSSVSSNKKQASGDLLYADDSALDLPPPSPVKGSNFDHKEFDSTDFDEPRENTRKAKKKAKSVKSSSLAVAKLSSQIAKKSKPMPVIVVTDIGADIDDTLALFALLGATDAVRIVAVVTSVNNGLHRGAVTRGFLRLLGIADEAVEILPSVDGCVAGCYIPDSFPTADEAALGDLGATPRRLVEICREHQDTGLLLYGIASLSPVAEAIKLDVDGVMAKAVRGVYLQGNVDLSKQGGDEKDLTPDPLKWKDSSVRLHPNPDAYNFKNDMNAARLVFSHFQDLVPFVILGKYAAYRVPIRKGDFSTWTHKISAAWKQTTVRTTQKVKIPNPPDLLHTAKRQMKAFRIGNPEKFDMIYKIPGNLSSDEIDRFGWFDTLPIDYVCSHPYDPLLGLKMILDIRKMQQEQGFGSNSAPALGSSKQLEKPLFQEYRCKAEKGHVHTLLGNNPAYNSVEDPNYVHDVLVDHISKGLSFHGGQDYA